LHTPVGGMGTTEKEKFQWKKVREREIWGGDTGAKKTNAGFGVGGSVT